MFIFLFDEDHVNMESAPSQFTTVEEQTVEESTPIKLKKYDPSNQKNQIEKEGNIYNSIFKLNRRRDCVP